MISKFNNPKIRSKLFLLKTAFLLLIFRTFAINKNLKIKIFWNQ